MIFLFIHHNFPAQYRHLVRHLVDQGNTVYFLTQPNDNDMQGVHKVAYTKPRRRPISCHPLTAEIDEAIEVGMATAEASRQLKRQGIYPDLIIGHNGWGETLFVKDVYPDVPLLSYFEFFYHAHGVDVDFDPEYTQVFSDPARFKTRNAVNLMGYIAADWGHTATSWQRSLYPTEMQARITAIHEGVDTELVRPDPQAWITLAREHAVLSRNHEVITYVSRNLEPYRGFHVLMRALPEIQRRRPRAHAIIVGGDDVSYGSPSLPGTTYRDMLLQEVGGQLDFNRVHFVGRIPYASYLNLLQVSSVHVYLTYPFVLSWSFIEALSSGCLVIGSAAPPVLEVLKDGINGLAVDFFSTAALADRVDAVFDHPDRMQTLRDAARQTAVTRFDLKTRQLPRWDKLIQTLVNRQRPEVEEI